MNLIVTFIQTSNGYLLYRRMGIGYFDKSQGRIVYIFQGVGGGSVVHPQISREEIGECYFVNNLCKNLFKKWNILLVKPQFERV